MRISTALEWNGTDGRSVESVSTHLGTDICSPAQGQAGRKLLLCRWAFPFRDDAAKTLYFDLAQEAQTCLGFDKPEADQLVNHPDSYDLQQFVLPDATLAISLKDKTALGQTLVFLRITK